MGFPSNKKGLEAVECSIVQPRVDLVPSGRIKAILWSEQKEQAAIICMTDSLRLNDSKEESMHAT